MANKPNMYETAPGIAVHPWINNPDTKFDAKGVFKTGLLLSASKPTTLNLQALIDEKAQEAFDRQTEKLSAVEKKKWKVYKPYEGVEDQTTGEPTGDLQFTFKRNHIITLQGGEEKELFISVYDSAGKVIDPEHVPAIYPGSTIKVLFQFRDVKVAGQKIAGVKLDFAAVKVLKLQQGKRSDPFSKEDPEDAPSDGYVWSPSDKGKDQSDDDHEEGGEF